jgi:hypothetical protein
MISYHKPLLAVCKWFITAMLIRISIISTRDIARLNYNYRRTGTGADCVPDKVVISASELLRYIKGR